MQLDAIFADLCTGLVLSVTLFCVLPVLAAFFSPGPDPSALRVQAVIKEIGTPVSIFYFLSSATYGLWAVLEGQMRVCTTAVVLSAGAWGVQVPLTYLCLFVWDKHLEAAGYRPQAMIWWTQCVAQLVMNLGMAAAILLSDWQKIADEVVAYNEEEDTEEALRTGRELSDITATSVWESLVTGEPAPRLSCTSFVAFGQLKERCGLQAGDRHSRCQPRRRGRVGSPGSRRLSRHLVTASKFGM